MPHILSYIVVVLVFHLNINGIITGTQVINDSILKKIIIFIFFCWMFLFPRSTFLHLQVVFKNKIVFKKTARMPAEIFFSVCCPIPNVSVLSLLLKLKTRCSFPSPVLISPVESTHHLFLTLHVPLIPLSLPASSSGSPCSTTGHACQKTR